MSRAGTSTHASTHTHTHTRTRTHERTHARTHTHTHQVLKGSAKIRNLALLVMGYGVAHRRARSGPSDLGRSANAIWAFLEQSGPRQRPRQGVVPSPARRPPTPPPPVYIRRLFEFAGKGQLRVLHPTVQGYQSVLADVSTYTGGRGGGGETVCCVLCVRACARNCVRACAHVCACGVWGRRWRSMLCV